MRALFFWLFGTYRVAADAVFLSLECRQTSKDCLIGLKDSDLRQRKRFIPLEVAIIGSFQ